VKRSVYRLHQIRLRVDKMLDLRDRRLLESLRIGAEELASDDPTACRRVGGAAAWLGRDAILVPSVRGAGDNLVVFVDQQDPDAPVEVRWSGHVEE
jgi:RES domain-containing protein